MVYTKMDMYRTGPTPFAIAILKIVYKLELVFG